MATNLYETGQPKRVIVEREEVRTVERTVERVVVFPLCEDCGRQTRTVTCEWCGGKKKRGKATLPTVIEGKAER